MKRFRLNITPKLFLAFLLFLFLPLIAFTASLYLYTVRASKVEILASIQSSFDQSHAAIDNKLNYIQSSSYYFLNSSNLLVLASETPDTLSTQAQLDLKNSLSLQFLSENFSGDIADTYLFIRTPFPLLEVSDKIYAISDVSDNLWLQYTLSRPSYSCFIPAPFYERDPSDVPASLSPDNCLSFVRKIPDPNNYQEISVIVRFDFKKSSLDELLANANCTPRSQTWLIDASGNLVTGTSASLPDSRYLNCSTVSFTQSTWDSFEAEGQTYILGRRWLHYADWYLVSAIPERDILSNGSSMGLRFILLALLMLVCTMLCLFSVSVSITSRIRLLAQNMHNYNHENPSLIPASLHQDEIGTLIDEYNNLITHIRDLQIQKERQEQELRSSELRILRAQMNPHFLYNTLEMLRWYAGNHDKTMVDEIIRQLSTFYKLSLNHGLEYYRVEDEVLLLKTYFNIMNMRYQNTMRFETEVDPEILPCRIPIILLQPILENAIMHGILLSPGKSGTICFVGTQDGNALRFSFQDDGVGIDPSTMAAINDGTFFYPHSAGSGGNSIGIRNIAGRIRLLYGEEYGITFSRPASGGTLAVIRIPADDAL